MNTTTHATHAAQPAPGRVALDANGPQAAAALSVLRVQCKRPIAHHVTVTATWWDVVEMRLLAPAAAAVKEHGADAAVEGLVKAFVEAAMRAMLG